MNLQNMSKIFTTAFGVMQAVESIVSSMKKGTATNKKEAYLDGLMVALNVTESIKGDIVQDEKFKKLMGNFADITIEISNFVRDYQANKVK